MSCCFHANSLRPFCCRVMRRLLDAGARTIGWIARHKDDQVIVTPNLLEYADLLISEKKTREETASKRNCAGWRAWAACCCRRRQLTRSLGCGSTTLLLQRVTEGSSRLRRRFCGGGQRDLVCSYRALAGDFDVHFTEGCLLGVGVFVGRTPTWLRTQSIQWYASCTNCPPRQQVQWKARCTLPRV